MIAVFAGNHLGCHARVVAVAFDQPGGTLGRCHAALGRRLANIFRILRLDNIKFRPLENERFRRVEADQRPRAVLGAVLHLVGHVRFNFATRQVLGQLLVAGFARGATRVFFDRSARLFHRLLQTLGGVRHVVRIAEVERQLVGVVEVTLATTPKRLLKKCRVSKLNILLLAVQLFVLLMKLFDRAGQLF